jgi:hypothetical protein
LAAAYVCDLNPNWPQRSKSSQVGEGLPGWIVTAKDEQRLILIAQAKDVYVYTCAICEFHGAMGFLVVYSLFLGGEFSPCKSWAQSAVGVQESKPGLSPVWGCRFNYLQ